MLALSQFGCQSDRPMSVSSPEVNAHVEDNSPSIWSEEIGPEGGTVVGANSIFVVPEDALSSSVSITMTFNPSLANEVVMGPSGQLFSEGCTLTINKPSGYNPSDTYHVFLWNPVSSTWVDQGGTDNGDTVSATIWHFSKYGVDKVS
jgi:hypothetical protein